MQKPLGLLSLLDEESTFPNGTDLTFANKLKQHLNSNSYFRGERGKAFTVCHYAGEVFTWIFLDCWLPCVPRVCQVDKKNFFNRELLYCDLTILMHKSFLQDYLSP